jgi:hypothetical protein
MMEPAPSRDVYRGLGRLVANATAAMNVTAPTAPMDYFFEHHSATLVFFIHEGSGTLETTFGPIAYGKAISSSCPRASPIVSSSALVRSTTGCTRASRGIRRRPKRPPPGSS